MLLLNSVRKHAVLQIILRTMCMCCLVADLDASDSSDQSAVEARARAGDAEAQNQLALRYLPCTGGEPDKHAEGLMWLRRAAEGGVKSAQVHMGINYRYGDDGVAKDLQESHKWFLRAAGDPFGVWAKLLSYLGVRSDTDVDIESTRHAQNNLGSNYRRGNGVQRDYTQALRWYEAAAKLGSAQAKKNLGLCYLNGWGVEKDQTKAASFFSEAYQSGEDRAGYYLACCYLEGSGVERDEKKGFEILEKVAVDGNHRAKARLAFALENGIHVTKDPEMALQLYREAYQSAQRELGRLDAE
jgi:TPR repeat protein